MKEQDKIKELFSEKLGNYSAPVNPELWNAIAAKVAVGSVAASSGLSLLAKGLIGLGAASVIGVSSYFILQEDSNKVNQIVAVHQETPMKEVENTENSTSTTDNKDISELNKGVVVNNKSLNQQNTISDEVEISKTVLKEAEPVYVPKIAPAVIPSVQNTQKEVRKEVPVEKQTKSEQTKTNPIEKVEVVKPVLAAEITLLPNSFTPNGDRVNDEFYLEFEGELLDFNIVILDKSNRTVFDSKDPHFRWSGLNKQGEMTERGSYYYIVTARDKNNNPINKYSSLSIER